MAGWADPRTLLLVEAQQRRDEGCVVPPDLVSRIEDLDDPWHPVTQQLYDELMALAEADELAAREPNDLAAIRALRPAGPRDLGWQPTDDELVDRLHGAWTGRAAGCTLGKPVEGMGIEKGRGAIRAHLERRGDWPLTDYFAVDGALWCPASQRENVAFAEPDDDLHYSVVALGVLEQHGGTFTWRDVGAYWLNNLPITAFCTAEAQAALTLQELSLRGRGGPATAEVTRRRWNPYREFIGAQIRSDGWAWAAAGRPELAAELAWRDASWTHERNGIYGEMFMAAVQAAAFVVDDPVELVQVGLSEIPADCRLAQAMHRLLDRRHLDWEPAVEAVEADCAGLHAVHTIPNALLCVLALLHGAGDLDRSVCLAVMAGMDTDCNGATVGSVVGAVRGRGALASPLADRLNDTLVTSTSQGTLKMRDLAERTATIWRSLRA
jgi:ADP-ribosylglycohydrolase